MKLRLKKILCNTGRNVTTFILLPEFFIVVSFCILHFNLLAAWVAPQNSPLAGQRPYSSSSHPASSTSEGQVLLQRGKEIQGKFMQRGCTAEQLWSRTEFDISPRCCPPGLCRYTVQISNKRADRLSFSSQVIFPWFSSRLSCTHAFLRLGVPAWVAVAKLRKTARLFRCWVARVLK